MKRPTLTNIVLLALCAAAAHAEPATQPAIEPDVFTFELTPTPPASPALKRSLYFGLADRIPGNAAPLILDAVLLMGPTAGETANKANDAYDAGDFKTFDSLVDSLDVEPMWDELRVAMRRPYSDFDPPVRERGELTLLPHLQSVRSLGWLIQARSLRQLRQGKVDDALDTLRLGYELGDKVTEPIIVSALVSSGMGRMMNGVIMHVMNDPQSPNLYWALANVPERFPVFRRAWAAEYEWLYVCRPRIARLREGYEPTPAEWRTILVDDMAYVYAIYGHYRPSGTRPHPDPITDASPELLRRAREDYAESHHVSVADAAKVDPAVALGHFYFRQWRVARDDLGKLGNLPYPLLLRRTQEHWDRLQQLRKEQPTNPFLEQIPQLHKATYQFARADRETAALTAVEALRSYAAGHNGALPERLDAITETPVPVNPATGLPFEYRLESGTATLSDTKSESTLTYTIKIRK